MKPCLDCGSDISARGNRAKRCAPCAAVSLAASRLKAKRAWAARNHDKILAKERRLYHKNPAKASAKRAKWAADNPGRVRALRKRWAENNREKQRESVRRWIAANPVAWAAHQAAMKHNRRVAAGRLDRADAVFMLDQPCAYCGQPSEHVEHCTPLSRGGRNDIFNCVGACARCNLEKGRMTVLEFAGLIQHGY